MSYIWMSCCIVVPHSRWSRRYLKFIIPSKTAVFLQCTINSIIPRWLCNLVLQLLLAISSPGTLLEALLNRSPLSRFESTVCEDIGSLHFYHQFDQGSSGDSTAIVDVSKTYLRDSTLVKPPAVLVVVLAALAD